MDVQHDALCTADLKLQDDEREPTNQHYDLDPDVFGLFLDPTLKYSSGLYLNESDSLEQSQIQKMEFIADQLGLQGGEKCLDIGCGWGSLAFFLAKKYNCVVVGVTPSVRQASYVRQKAERLGLSERVQVDVARIQETVYRAGSFDAISLVGSIVHIEDKRRVISECFRICRPRGRVYLSETCFRNWAKYHEFSERPGTRFVRDAIFGWAELIPLSAFIDYFELEGFSLCSLTDLTAHYVRTIGAWHRNVEHKQAALEALQPGLAACLLQYFETATVALRYTVKQYAVVSCKSR